MDALQDTNEDSATLPAYKAEGAGGTLGSFTVAPQK